LKIIGIDPGSHRTGYAILEKSGKGSVILDYGTIESEPGLPSSKTLLTLEKGIYEIIKSHKPEMASVEVLFFSKNTKTASRVFESRGVILLTLAKEKIKVVEPTVSQIKKGVTGNGNADKKQVKRALEFLFPGQNLKGHDDSWDAVAAAFVGLAMKGSYQL
jgi:crossover junction endodeoxyribonuclease RuvC